MTPPRSHAAWRAFTLSELLVVVAVLAVLVALLLPAGANLLRRVNDITCRNNLKRIGEAAAMVVGAGGKKNDLTAANWYVTLSPKVDKAGRIFYCPEGPQPTALSGDDGGSVIPGGGNVESNYVLVRTHYAQANFAWGYDTYVGAGYPLSDDSPWMLHFSQHQKSTVTDGSGRYFGDTGAYWGTGKALPLQDIAYVPDGTGSSYWGVTFGTWWGAACTNVFMKVEPDGKGVRLWTQWDGIAGSWWSTYACLWATANENCPTSKGPMGLARDCAFATAVLHGVNHWGPLCYAPNTPNGYAWVVNNGVTTYETQLWQGPGPGLLQTEGCSGGQPGCSGGCTGRNDWIILGDPTGSPEPPSGGGGQIVYSATNYGMNEQAVAMSRGGQILALDYPDTVAKPTEDNWNGPTWDADGDGTLDFARHGGRVNVLFVDGTVRQMTPDEIDPQDQAMRATYWMP
ncbi:MAG: H-X9-DG-CTERM domain-containing protein [Planctomycetaceae bacterium]|nr:prepilin-type N-terminal cleavage/methylation domain-containing protein [Planctomycetaceae bacterium]